MREVAAGAPTDPGVVSTRLPPSTGGERSPIKEKKRMRSRQRITRLAAIGASTTALIGIYVLAGAGSAVAQSSQSAQSAAPAATRTFSCGFQQFCDYVYDNGTDRCFAANPFSGVPSDNWSYYGCRNIDGSLYNNTAFTFRVYYAPNLGDPHACVPPYTKVSNLFNYDFISGRGPHDLVVGNDIASFTFNLSPCTNTPLVLTQ
jgi:hypothetical protein